MGIPDPHWGRGWDVNRFPVGDGDGDGDEAEKRGWGWLVTMMGEGHPLSSLTTRNGNEAGRLPFIPKSD
ncbi:hypothetical protein Tco_0546760 [Tanacetum coccineum]